MSEHAFPSEAPYCSEGSARHLSASVPVLAEGNGSLFQITMLEETTSTNDEVKRALEAGEPEGYAVCARRQTEGYGRQGRLWASPDGGLYLSVLLRPCVKPAQLPTLSLAVSIAVRRALASLVGPTCPDNIRIKWPNDLVVALLDDDSSAPGIAASCALEGDNKAEGAFRVACAEVGRREAGAKASLRGCYRKLCGISLEAHAGGLCVGIGVNVQGIPCAPGGMGENSRVYLSDLGYAGAIEAVAVAVLHAMDPVYKQWCAEGFTAFQREYESHAFLTNRFAGMLNQCGDLMAEGVVAGVDEHGRLLLQSSEGATVAISSGEAHLR